ncbi:MAG: xylulokinase [Pseudomonadota bacterium]
MLVLGLDLGTSAVKSVLVQGDKIVAEGLGPLDVSSPKAGWSEQDPEAWIGAARTAITALGPQAADVAAIGLSGQMHGAVMLDAGDAPVRPCILWNDSRSAPQCATLEARVPEIGMRAGVRPLPGFTAPKLMWMKEEEPEAYARIASVMLPKDYLGFWLTGVKASDTSDAAGTLWLDQRTRGWDAALAEASDTDPDWLPALHAGTGEVGGLRAGLAAELGLPAGIPVFAGGGDAATGAISVGAARPGACFISLGTSGQLLVVDEAYAPNPGEFVHAFAHTLPGLWYRMAAMLNGARPMAWFAGVLGLSVEEMLAEAAQARPDRVPLFLPYLTGERSPHGDPAVRAGFYGLDDATGRPEMARAVVEALAFMMRDARDSFGESFAPDGPIPVLGGGAQSDLVLETLASVLAHPVARAEAGRGGPAYGAARLAQVGAGALAESDLAFTPRLTRVFEPTEAELEPRLARFRELYARLRGGL